MPRSIEIYSQKVTMDDETFYKYATFEERRSGIQKNIQNDTPKLKTMTACDIKDLGTKA